METLKPRRARSEVFWALNENNFIPMILYPAKLSFKNDGAIKIFHDKQKLKQYMTNKLSLQKILQRILKRKMKANKTMRGQEVSNHIRIKDKLSESSNDLAAHTQILKK
jgi:hypothetical protein